MNGNKLLIGILIVLTIGVLITGGLVAYVALGQAQEGDASTQASSAEQALQDNLQASSEAAQTDTTPTGPRIVYASDLGGNASIYIINTDGENADEHRQISSPDLGGYCFFPTWSPDGRRVAYSVTARPYGVSEDTPTSVWVSTADGSEHIRVSSTISDTSFFHIRPTWSPDGELLAFVSQEDIRTNNSATIHIVRSDGSGNEREIAFPRHIEYMVWSPTKNELLIVSGNPRNSDTMIVHLMSADGAEITEIFQGAVAADWLPGGESIVVGDFTVPEIRTIDLNQSDQEQAARAIAQTALQPLEVAWSPSGEHVAVATSGHYRQDFATVMSVVTVESGQVDTLADNDGWVRWPSWSADGRRLTFTWGELSNEPMSNLWIYDTVTGQLDQLTTDTGIQAAGDWSP